MNKDLYLKVFILCITCAVFLSGCKKTENAAEGDFSYSDLAEKQFIFSSGASAWSTELMVSEDGSFQGSYMDSVMAESAPEYPHGSIYLSEFTGHFSNPVRINNYTYQFSAQSIKYAEQLDTSEIIDGVRYVHTDAYGVSGTKEFYLYLPGSPLDELPEEYKNCILSSGISEGEEYLPFYGLYSMDIKSGFWSTKKTDEAAQGDAVEENSKEQAENDSTQDYEHMEETDSGMDYHMLEGNTFFFGTDTGSWLTELNITEDGEFSGYYSDTIPDEKGTGYSNGTIYCCSFTGHFSELIDMNDHISYTTIEELQYQSPVGTEEINNSDATKYVYSEPYGIALGNQIQFYRIGTPMDELPDGYKAWLPKTELANYTDSGLPYYGMFDSELESAFRSYDVSYDEETGEDFNYASDTPSIEDRIASDVFTQEQEYEKLDNPNITQTEMNEVAATVYQIWDNELNFIWGEIKAGAESGKIDAGSMQSVKKEQESWLDQRDKAMKAAGAEAAGGSMQSCLEWNKGAELTEARVNELVRKFLHD